MSLPRLEHVVMPPRDETCCLPKLAVVRDYPDEGWPSMDLCAEMLGRQLRDASPRRVSASDVCPRFRRRLQGLLWLKPRAAVNGDRLLNRHWHYPRFLKQQRAAFDYFHVADHSYAHLVHVLPAARTGVYCHDIDTFRCLLEPGYERRPRWFRAIIRRILGGLQKAAIVFHNSLETRRQIERHGLIDPRRLVHAPLGVSPEFTAEVPDGDGLWAEVAGLTGTPFLLHVGSCIARKGIGLLLELFAAIRRQNADLRLVKVGADWSSDQRGQITRLGIADSIVSLRGLDRRELADLYRTAAVVLLPSQAEGFGLPLIEALACGAPVVASDIPVLREVGADAATYCPVGDLSAWAAQVSRLLADPAAAPPRELRLSHAARFTWAAHARTIAEAYLGLPA
jgi:glycosyltransferase involved in cell wall biosynthesis